MVSAVQAFLMSGSETVSPQSVISESSPDVTQFGLAIDIRAAISCRHRRAVFKVRSGHG